LKPAGVGGTWYWNRLPGARFDSESWTYGYSFSQELLDEWDWGEHFATQPETERYLNYVADKFDLRRDIQFTSRVTASHYREDARSWDIVLEDGPRYTTRLVSVEPRSGRVSSRNRAIETLGSQRARRASHLDQRRR
jgi:cation diffusion facilitator CzcD-associated flavoprotein CzcO